MRTVRLDHALAATLALLLTAGGAWAGSEESAGSEPQKIEAVSAPQKAETAPPSAPDTVVSSPAPAANVPAAASVSAAAPSTVADKATDAELNARIPLPDPLDMPPPSAKDLAMPAPAPDNAVTPATAQTPQPAGKDAATAQTPVQPEAKDAATAQTPAAPPAKDAVAPLATTLAAADVPVAEKLREFITGKLERFIDRKKDRTALEAFYTGRGFAPLWLENGGATARADAAIARLKAADADGLDAGEYSRPDFKAAADRPDAMAEAELKLTVAVLTFARDAQAGRINPSRISSNIDFPQHLPDPAEVLTKIAESTEVAKTLDNYNPPHAGFRALKEKLAELRGSSGDSARIPDGAALKLGMDDPRVPELRARLGVPANAANTTYDSKLADAVKSLQRRNDMKPTGVLDTRTLSALNGPKRNNQVDTILVNMERWRWLPRDLGKAYVIVNIPDYTLKVVRDGATAWHTRIVVGKPTMPTPIFSDQIENIVVNPTWHVPESIVVNEYLPVLQQDPTVLARMGLVVEHERDGRISVTQPPGDGNALGHMKFNFPNRFNVYLHDTPDKGLFNEARRAFSHGCMRVQNPWEFGEVLTAIAMPKGGYSAQKFKSMFGRNEQSLQFEKFIPVHLTYQTAYVDDAGKLVIRDDIYGMDSRVQIAFKNPDRRFVDVATNAEPRRDRPTAASRAAVANARKKVVRGQERETAGGFSFFERLFR
jgi:murein L,D-transpeptidase YcbB/YkuD